eukprot:superscaffoldBa00001275_g9872
MLSRTEHRGVCRLLSSVMSGTESHSDREEDYRFLHSMLMEKKLHLLFKIHERLKRFEKRSPNPVQEHAASLASDLAEDLIYHGWRDEVKELVALFSKPHFKSLLSVHDAVARRDFEPTLPPIPDGVLEEDEDSVKIVSLVKTKEPLAHSQGEITFKIIPASSKEDMPSNKKKLFVRTLFDYDPSEDPTVPCKDAAVPFKRGDILQIVSKEDDAWWQACHLGDSKTRAGLIPSQQLHERRVALQRPKALFKPRRVKPPTVTEDVDYGAITGIHIAGLRRSFRLGRKSSAAREAARSRRWSSGVHGSICPPTYIEVIPYCKDPKDRHRLVILVGPSGVGVNELKRRLLIADPDRYGVTVPHTTREKRRQEKEGMDYHFVSVLMFEEAILNHRFIEYGIFKGHYYGTSLDSVHRVMAEGKVCLLDVHPSLMVQKPHRGRVWCSGGTRVPWHQVVLTPDSDDVGWGLGEFSPRPPWGGDVAGQDCPDCSIAPSHLLVKGVSLGCPQTENPPVASFYSGISRWLQKVPQAHPLSPWSRQT